MGQLLTGAKSCDREFKPVTTSYQRTKVARKRRYGFRIWVVCYVTWGRSGPIYGASTTDTDSRPLVTKISPFACPTRHVCLLTVPAERQAAGGRASQNSSPCSRTDRHHTCGQRHDSKRSPDASKRCDLTFLSCVLPVLCLSCTCCCVADEATLERYARCLCSYILHTMAKQI